MRTFMTMLKETWAAMAGNSEPLRFLSAANMSATRNINVAHMAPERGRKTMPDALEERP
jgi:hypothetical protein